jgi:nitrate/TMAO reductase-like tetraheme cytochrome c subunit
MFSPASLVLAVIVLSIILVAVLVVNPGITATRGGKVLAFIAMIVFPLLAGGMGVTEHLAQSKSTEFCLSCHVMEDYGKSLKRDDRAYIPSVHYQNHLVPKDDACFTCHTDYTMYGDVNAKLRGLKHVYKYYLSTPSNPIKLYTPYNNRECLHCHLGARSFEEGATHNADPSTLAKVKSNDLGCTSTGCHNQIHEVKSLKDAKFWEPAK